MNAVQCYGVTVYQEGDFLINRPYQFPARVSGVTIVTRSIDTSIPSHEKYRLRVKSDECKKGLNPHRVPDRASRQAAIRSVVRGARHM